MEIAIMKTNRSEYDIKEAATGSITVGELIDALRDNFSMDTPIVFSNDGGYTYGYITERCLATEEWEEEPEEDMYCDRGDMVYDLADAVRKNEDRPIQIEGVWIGVGDEENCVDKEVKWLGFDDSRNFGILVDVDDEKLTFMPIEELSDDVVEAVWDSVLFCRK